MPFESKDKPKISPHSKKSDRFDGWMKCPGCLELIHEMECKKNLSTCPRCQNHFRISGSERLEYLVDKGSFKELFREVLASDRLKFTDLQPYTKRLEKARSETGLDEALRVGVASIESRPLAIGVFEFQFMGGSMGSVVGERLTRLIEHAEEKSLPLVIVSSSGGARMQESIFSLMQMAKISGALARLHDARLPYISVLTDPTSGGVTASFASLGDIIIAEPDALICFTGPRVIEQTLRTKLPPGFQKAEFLLEHGFIDSVVSRHEMKKRISSYLNYLLD